MRIAGRPIANIFFGEQGLFICLGGSDLGDYRIKGLSSLAVKFEPPMGVELAVPSEPAIGCHAE